jgi:hypothetical protein
MPSKSVWRIVEYLKEVCGEEYGGDRRIDEVSLYRHVEEMLDLERKPPHLAPGKIVEKQVRAILDIEVTVTVDSVAKTGHLASRTEIWTAAEWAWVLFRDFFGEYPPTGNEDGYVALVDGVIEMRHPHVIEALPPLS